MEKQLDFLSNLKSKDDDLNTTKYICDKIILELIFIIQVLNNDLYILKRFKGNSDRYNTLTSILNNRSSQLKYVAFLGDIKTTSIPLTKIESTKLSYKDSLNSKFAELLKELIKEVNLDDVDNMVIYKIYKLM